MIALKVHYGHLLRILHWSFDQTMTHALERMDLTASQGHIMGFIAGCKRPPCSRDIEQAFHLSHPTVSGLLSRLEKKEFICFLPDENDRRCKRIHVTAKGREFLDLIHQTIQDNERRLVDNFTEEERAQFASFLERSISNLGIDPYQRKHKEENNE